jgi:voltage-gated potassium channel
MLAAALMLTGIGIFGTFTAFVASAFPSPADTEQERELEALRRELRELREAVQAKDTAAYVET